MLPPQVHERGWTLPGGGLEPKESLFECGCREVWEETGLEVDVHGVLFLREWVVPRYCPHPDSAGRHGFGLEVFLHATPTNPAAQPRREDPTMPVPEWVTLKRLETLPAWPVELKALAKALRRRRSLWTIPSFVSVLQDPSDLPGQVQFNRKI